jgi:hypothetical protein
MGKIELKKDNGDVFVEFKRVGENSYLQANWIGRQTIETVRQGGSYYIQLLQEQPCSKLLNNHHELIGPWDIANDWIVEEWTPRVRALGLTHLAQVLAPGIYGQMSWHQLHQRIDDRFEIKLFDDEAAARSWLLGLSVTSVIN